MRASKAKSLSKLFRSFLKAKSKASKSKPFPLTPSPIAEDSALELDNEMTLSALKFEPSSDSEGSPNLFSHQVSSILCGGVLVKKPDMQLIDVAKTLQTGLHIPWFELPPGKISMQRKEVSCERKQKHVFKCSQGERFSRLVKMCADKLGTHSSAEVFGKLGRETGVKEYITLIGMCIDQARETDDEYFAIEQIGIAFHLFKSMREQGFELEEEAYRPLLMYLIEMSMVHEFMFFCDTIKEENPSSVSRLGYYEMMLWLQINNEEKIEHLCNYVAVNDSEDTTELRESYLLAICESDRKQELLQLLEIIDITRLSSPKSVANIFQSLGRLALESVAEKFLLAFKTCEYEEKAITDLIATYAVSIPNLVIWDVFSKFKDLHRKLEVSPSSSSYEKLILHGCNLLEVQAALDIVDVICEAGFTLSTQALNSILQISEETCEYGLVHRVYSIISGYNLKPNCETFRFMISMCVKMKDFRGAYTMLDNLKEKGLEPTSNMFNAIMGGYFRQKDIGNALRVLKHMQSANVKPDSQTFSYLINNCETEEDIIKYYEDMKQYEIQPTKQVFMALINAYAACGQLEKAKQVVSDPEIPVKNLNEIKSVLASALASNGQLSEAFLIFEAIKQTKHHLEPKAVISLIEHTKSDGELDRLLELQKELHDPDYWIDGCCRIILYCVQNKHLSSAVDLCKQLVAKFQNEELLMETIFDEIFSLIATSESTHLEIGMDLLCIIKEELGLLPSRKSLDFLLSACTNAKDLHNARLIWAEYQAAGLPYNVLTYLRMYQALLASGDYNSAKSMLRKISKDDLHVCTVIKACQKTYGGHSTRKRTKKMGDD